jgi:oxygen-dependent protoporphyrinogen oxidase
LDAGIASILGEIPYSTMTVVCFGYRRERITRDLDGFGYLIPKQEGKNILGTLWDSSIFENRAPDGFVLLRSMMGGACFPQYINLPDEEVQKRVQADLQTIMGIKEVPDFVRIFRHDKAIPQYTVGHGKRLAALEERANAHPGLILTGNSYRGIGLNDCVAAAQKASDEAIEHLRR